MISHGHGDDPYSQSGCCARGEAAIQAHGGDWPFTRRACPGAYGLVPKPMRRPMPRADIETCSFDLGLRGALTGDHDET